MSEKTGKEMCFRVETVVFALGILFLDALVTSGLFLFQWNVAYQDPSYYYYRDYNDVGYW